MILGLPAGLLIEPVFVYDSAYTHRRGGRSFGSTSYFKLPQRGRSSIDRRGLYSRIALSQTAGGLYCSRLSTATVSTCVVCGNMSTSDRRSK